MSVSNIYGGMSYGSKKESNEVFEYRKTEMCSRWNRLLEKKYTNMDLSVYKNSEFPPENGDFLIRGRLKGSLVVQSGFIKFWAANPADYGCSFYGSGLPYPNEEVAYENTINKGVVPIEGNEFTFNVYYPNSYYRNMGTVLVPPTIKIVVVNGDNERLSPIFEVKIGEGIPYRTLDFTPLRNWSKGPLFYQNIPLITTQEKILINSAYPKNNHIPSNFWGFKPPM
jgi:hypothetical protein